MTIQQYGICAPSVSPVRPENNVDQPGEDVPLGLSKYGEYAAGNFQHSQHGSGQHLSSVINLCGTAPRLRPSNRRRGWLDSAMVAVAILATTATLLGDQPAAELLTVAEQSEYSATASYDQTMRFCRELARSSESVSLTEMGKSVEGRSLPLLIISDPPIQSAAATRGSKKLVVFAMGNIHAGEVCGKEALLMLARDLGTAPQHPLLSELVLVFAPIYNADGNERLSPDNRPNQVGPRAGMGQRANAQGLDLNRDHMKLQSPEARALARFLTDWQPAVAIDCHTTNGSYHRYALTYDSPRHPATAPDLVRYARDEFLPDVSHRLEQATGYKTFYYGNFDRQRQRWETYPALPRYSTHYFGLRNVIGILSEAYAYASYRDRVLATRDFVKHCLLECAENKDRISELLAASGQPASSEVPIRFEHAALSSSFQVAGYVEEERNGKPVATDTPHEYEVEYFGQALATKSVQRPFAYLIPPAHAEVVANLQQHGIEVRVVREDIELDVEVARTVRFQLAQRRYQGQHLVSLETQTETEARRISAGMLLVPTEQALGSLAVNLLEPEAQDGLATWNFFEDAVAVNAPFPVLRLPAAAPILTAALPRPALSASSSKQPVTFETLYGARPVRFGGRPTSGIRWLEDGEHFWQTKSGQQWKVTAVTGRAEPLPLDEAAVRHALQQLGISAKDAKRLAGRVTFRLNPSRTAAVLSHNNDLYFVTLDGKEAHRLTDSPSAEELATFSPDGTKVAFVRDFDLYLVDLASRHERRLTSGGNPLLRNGKCDWVYYEEINHRNWKAFKWSPDSQSLAFLQFDDAPVDTFTVLNHIPTRQSIETERYPLAGRPNPHVRLGLVSAEGGSVRWAQLADYSPSNMLISHFNWLPDAGAVYYYVQDRAQQWLDFCRFELAGGRETKLFRERTGRWVDNPGDPWFLKDGSFLLFSERDGWKHIYRFDQAGQQLSRVTEGPWEVRQIEAVNEENGWIYFSATRDSHIAANLYRVRLDGSELTKLTSAPGNHRVTVNPQGTMFVDSFSSHRTPPQVNLCDSDGRTLRRLDINPIPALDQYELSEVNLHQIQTRDGFTMEATLVKPPDLDPARKYPVWLMTYGGPHAPRVSDSWSRGRAFDQLLAQMGIVAFTVDPRSASGKGAASTWKAYRQLGIQELQDIEDALDWLTQQPYVDAERIGMSGHSYGGFMTAFAMTHSRRFAAGIAGAPVTDWRNYDTIYTERYMNTPQENPQGYRDTSVVAAAKHLHGRLLLIHGARDDNVHIANTLQLVQALQRADKPFEMMIYPSNRHGISGRHYRRLMVDFIRRTMLAGHELPSSRYATTPPSE